MKEYKIKKTDDGCQLSVVENINIADFTNYLTNNVNDLMKIRTEKIEEMVIKDLVTRICKAQDLNKKIGFMLQEGATKGNIMPYIKQQELILSGFIEKEEDNNE